MRRWLVLLLLCLLPVSSVWSQGAPFNSAVLQNAVSPGTQNGNTMTVTGLSITTFYLTYASGAAGTVNFEGTVDNTNYVSLTCVPLAGGATVTIATTSGTWRCNTTGMSLVRARISGGNSTGTVTVNANASGYGFPTPTGGGAPSTSTYILQSSDANLPNAQSLGTIASGLVTNTLAGSTGTLSILANVAAGAYVRSAGVLTMPVWSTLLLPNSATTNYIPFATTTNTWGESSALTFDGTTLNVNGRFSNTGTGTRTGLTLGDQQDIGAAAGVLLRFNNNAVNAANAGISVLPTGNFTSTSGNQQILNPIATFAPSSGSANFAMMHINPTVNGTSSGTAYGILLASKTNALTGGTIKLFSAGRTTTDGFTGYTEAYSIATDGSVNQVGVTFASLPTPASNGTLIYCSNCTIANPCATGGTGAFAKRLNNIWVCN